MREYHLYRAKFIKSAQLQLLVSEQSASTLFLNAINDKPALKLSSGNVWHIGNLKYIDNTNGSFAVGRTTKNTVEKFDEESGDFKDHIDDSAPYTVVVFDCAIGLLGIAKKSKLAPDASAVAKRIKSLFEQTETIVNSGVEVRIDPIPDPDDFIAKLRKAYLIKKFRATFTGPNPTDADELFQKPLSVYAQQIGADKGILEVHGHALNEEVAEAIAKSTAATGNTASARVIYRKGSKPTPISMKKEAVVLIVDSEASPENILASMQAQYSRIRG